MRRLARDAQVRDSEGLFVVEGPRLVQEAIEASLKIDQVILPEDELDHDLIGVLSQEKIQFHLPNFVFMEAPIGEDPDKRDYIVSNEKLEATGFKPGHSLDDGIIELIKGYKMIRNDIYGNF